MVQILCYNNYNSFRRCQLKKEPKRKTSKYSRFNGSLEISDPDTISNVKIEQEREIIENQRLGSYDFNGKYSIPKEIIGDLLKLPKQILSVKAQDPLRGKKDVYRLTAKLPGFDKLDFLLEVDNQFADIYLLEKAYKEGGNYFDTHEVHLKSVLISEENSIEKIMKNLKINTDTDDGGRKIDESEIIDLLLRKIYLQSVAQKLKEKSIGAEREVFEDVMATLKSSGAYGEKILATFVARLDTRQSILSAKGTPEYNRALNDVMMSSIYLQTTDENLKDPKIKAIYDKIVTLRQQTIEPIMQEAKDSITATAIKGRFVEKYKQDIPKEEMQAHFETLASTRMVDNESSQVVERESVAPAPVVERESKADRIKEYLDKREQTQAQEQGLSAVSTAEKEPTVIPTKGNRVEAPEPVVVDKRQTKPLEEAAFIGVSPAKGGNKLETPTMETPVKGAAKEVSQGNVVERQVVEPVVEPVRTAPEPAAVFTPVVDASVKAAYGPSSDAKEIAAADIVRKAEEKAGRINPEREQGEVAPTAETEAIDKKAAQERVGAVREGEGQPPTQAPVNSIAGEVMEEWLNRNLLLRGISSVSEITKGAENGRDRDLVNGIN